MNLSKSTFAPASVILLLTIVLGSCQKPDCVHAITGEYRASHSVFYLDDYGNMDTTYSVINENLDLVVKRKKDGVLISFKGNEYEFPITNCSGSYSWEIGGTQQYTTVEAKFSSGALEYSSKLVADQGSYSYKTTYYFSKL